MYFSLFPSRYLFPSGRRAWGPVLPPWERHRLPPSLCLFWPRPLPRRDPSPSPFLPIRHPRNEQCFRIRKWEKGKVREYCLILFSRIVRLVALSAWWIVLGNHLFSLSSSHLSFEKFSFSVPYLVPIIGTTAEVRSFKKSSNGFIAIAKGVQRFRLLNQGREREREGDTLTGSALILSEESPFDLPRGVSLFPYLYRDRSYSTSLSCLKPWIWKQYDPILLAKRVSLLMDPPSPDSPSQPFPYGRLDLNRYSYWVAQNLPLDDDGRLRLLRCESTSARLKVALSFLENSSPLCCKRCGTLLSHRKHVFSMSEEGSVGTFVNPGGYIHQIVTLYHISRARLIGNPSTEDSWFPGYSWTITNCMCHAHIGWRFTADKSDLVPRVFWGLRRNAIGSGESRQIDTFFEEESDEERLSEEESEEEEEEEEEVMGGGSWVGWSGKNSKKNIIIINIIIKTRKTIANA